MTAVTAPRHRVSTTTAQMRALADSVVDASVWSMDSAEAGRTLVELTRLEAQVVELKARVAAHADEVRVGSEVAASSTASWLAHETRTTRAEACRTVRLGQDLEAHPLTREALAGGDLHVEQVRVVVRWVDRLPADLGAEVIETAERHLLTAARDHDARALGRLGAHLWEVIAPDEADAHEAAVLEQQEKAALKVCSLTMHDDGDGKTRGKFTLPTAHAATLRKMLTALAAPRHVAATQGPGVERPPTPEAMGKAFIELIERYPADRLPTTGSVSATMLVLIDEDSLLGRLEKAGVLDTGDKISPSLARRLACEAGILPVVLSGDSQPLDVGRRRRMFTEAQRAALFVRDRGCRATGCDRTLGLHAHHQTRWTDGGTTDLANGVSLCPWHHHRAHDTTYRTTYHPNGDVDFHRRE